MTEGGDYNIMPSVNDIEQLSQNNCKNDSLLFLEFGL